MNWSKIKTRRKVRRLNKNEVITPPRHPCLPVSPSPISHLPSPITHHPSPITHHTCQMFSAVDVFSLYITDPDPMISLQFWMDSWICFNVSCLSSSTILRWRQWTDDKRGEWREDKRGEWRYLGVEWSHQAERVVYPVVPQEHGRTS